MHYADYRDEYGGLGENFVIGRSRGRLGGPRYIKPTLAKRSDGRTWEVLVREKPPAGSSG